MKTTFKSFIGGALLLFALTGTTSCEKIKQEKAYKNLFGNYTCDDSVYMVTFPDSSELYAKHLSISEYGTWFKSSNSEEATSVFTRDEDCDAPEYDFKLSFNKTQLFVMDPEYGLVEAPTYSSGYLNSGRKFYIKSVSEDVLNFVVVYDSGETETHVLRK